MHPDTSSPFAAVVAAVEPGARLLEVRRLAGGLSAQMTVLSVQRPDGGRPRLTVRQVRHPRSGRRTLALGDQFRLLVALHREGLPVPRPRLFDDSGRILPHPYAVFDYVDGAPRVVTTDPEGTGRMFAAQLAAIHAVDGAGRRWPALPRRAAEVRRQLQEPPELPDEALGESRIRRALRLAPFPANAQRPTLLHGDFWVGNVLWRHDAIVAVIDWEEAAVGDRLVDVATTRLDLLWSFGRASLAAFTDTYLSLTATDPAALPWWDLVAALRPVGVFSAWVADWADFGRPEMNATDMRADHRWFVDQAVDRLGP